MAQVNVTVSGKVYRMACGDGEEKHLIALAEALDGKIAELRGAFGEIGDMRLHVMAAIYFADEAADLKMRLEKIKSQISAIQADVHEQSSATRSELDRVASALDGMAARIETATKKIANS